MMRKFTICLAMCAAFFLLSNCKDDEAVSPPKSSLTADKASGVVKDDVIKDKITFTINEVNAESVALLPYGLEHQSWGSVTVSFKDGKAIVPYEYEHVGTFKAVVVSNNHTADGKSVKNSYSNEVTITITSGHNEISGFSFAAVDGGQKASTATDISGNDIMVTVPYGQDRNGLIATFTADAFTTVNVGSVAQESGKTPNNFTNPVVYTVKAADGTSQDYTVTVVNTAQNNATTFKSFSGKQLDEDGTSIAGTLATSGDDIIFYRPMGSDAVKLDSVAFSYELDNGFGAVHRVKGGTAETNKLKQGTHLENGAKLNVKGQDSTIHQYTVKTVVAPKLTIYGAGGEADNTVRSVNTGFNVLVKALEGTVEESTLDLTFSVTYPDVTLNSITLIDEDHSAGEVINNNSTHTVNFNSDVAIILNITDGDGLTYDIKYTAGLTELK